MIQPHLIFSYWLVLWYILYELRYVKYNPKFWLIFALVINIVELFGMLYFKRFFMAFTFLIAITIIKIIPIFLLRNTVIYNRDIMFGLLLFIIYNGWLYYNNYSLYKLFYKMYISIKTNNNELPLMTIMYEVMNIKK